MAKEGTRYSTLAEFGQDQGYADLKPDTIHHWTRLGILPKAEIAHIGFKVRAVSEPIRLGQQLLRACKYRYDWPIRDLAIVGVNVWMDNFPVSDVLIRRGLTRVADAPNRLLVQMERRGGLPAKPTTADLIDAAAISIVYERHLRSFFSELGHPRNDELAEGLSELIRLLVEPGESKPPLHLAAVASLVGMDGKQFARKFPAIAPSLAPPALQERVANATASDLETARDRANAELAESESPVHPMVRVIIVLAFLGIGELAHSG